MVALLAACQGDPEIIPSTGSENGDHGSTTTVDIGTTGETSGGNTGGSTSEASSDSGESGVVLPPPVDCGDPAAGDAIDLDATVAIDCGFAATCEPTAQQSTATQLPGPLTFVAEVRLQPRPAASAAIVSRWDMAASDRAFEFGIDQSQIPYLWLSPDGTHTPTAPAYSRAYQQLRVGETYEVAAVVVPGERIAMYVDGVKVHEQFDALESINVGSAELAVGRRTGAREGFLAGALGRVRVFDHALTDDEIASLAVSHGRCAELPGLPPITALTSGPKFHWFGYYDKFQFDPSDRFVLGMAVDFEDRPVTSDDVLELGMVDLANDNAWTTIGESRAWNWQQGCMLQWVPGSSEQVIWNDRLGEGANDSFIARILNVVTLEESTLDRPIFTIAPNAEVALGIDFERYQNMTPGYGYSGITDPNFGDTAPADAGIYSIDLASGAAELIISYEQIAAIPSRVDPQGLGKHYFYALLVNPSSTRFFFYDRAVIPGVGTYTRIFTANLDGSDVFLLDDQGNPSHIDWRDDTTIVAYSGDYVGYARFEDQVGYVENLLDYSVNGHQTFLPNSDWMVSDTYPDTLRFQNPFLYHVPSDEVFALGHLHSEPRYTGEDRCDNHPRHSRDGRKIVVDSPHGGGRQMYMIDIGAILDAQL